MLVVPKDQQQTADEKKAWSDWAKALGVDMAPTEVSDGQFAPGSPVAVDPNSPAIIYSPQPNTKLTGVTPIVGRAFSDSITGYRLEYGMGNNPTTWTQILTAPFSVQGGTVGVWDVTNLDPGIYTLRLVVAGLEEGRADLPGRGLGQPGPARDDSDTRRPRRRQRRLRWVRTRPLAWRRTARWLQRIQRAPRNRPTAAC